MDSILDNGISGEVPQPGGRAGGSASGDRLVALEGKMARLESQPRNNSKDQKKPVMTRPLVNGREICWDFNSKQTAGNHLSQGGARRTIRNLRMPVMLG